MAHMLEESDNMAYAVSGGKPWHGLGIEVTGKESPAEMARKAKLDWRVELQPMMITLRGQQYPVADHFALTRMDTGRVLDVVGQKYEPVQNVEALDFFTKFVAEGNMTMETAGSLQDGRRVWGLARINKGRKPFSLKSKDELFDYVLLSSPHMTGEALIVKFTSVRVVCWNTYSAALSNPNGSSFRLVHISKFDERMRRRAAEAMGLAIEQSEAFHEKARLLSSVRAKEPDVLKFVFEWSGSKFKMREESGPVDLNRGLEDVLRGIEQATERTPKEADLNRIGKIVWTSIYDSPGADLPSAKGTWWGVFNGVTHACDHALGRTDSRLNEAWFGSRALRKESALESVLTYAEGVR